MAHRWVVVSVDNYLMMFWVFNYANRQWSRASGWWVGALLPAVVEPRSCCHREGSQVMVQAGTVYGCLTGPGLWLLCKQRGNIQPVCVLQPGTAMSPDATVACVLIMQTLCRL